MNDNMFNNSPRRQDIAPQPQSGVDLSSVSMNLGSFRDIEASSSRGTVDIHPKRTVGCDKSPDADLAGIKVALPSSNAVIVSGATPKEFAALLEKA
jgi:hypothetical protein